MATAAAAATRGGRYIEAFRADPVDRIKTIRAGVPASEVKALTRDLGLDQGVVFKALGLKTATVNRKVAQGGVLSPDESERVLGLVQLIGQVQAMVEESGNLEEFDAPASTATWLCARVPALGGVQPMQFLDTMEGQAVVSRLLAQVQAGVYV